MSVCVCFMLFQSIPWVLAPFYMWCVCLESSVACADCLHSPSPPGVSKIVTVDVKGAPFWMKIKDLADGVTYNFRIRAKTFTYGPEVEANITMGPGEGSSTSG